MVNLKAAFSGCDCGACGNCLGASGSAPRRRRLGGDAAAEAGANHLAAPVRAARAFAAGARAEFEEALRRLVELPTVTPGGGHDDDCRSLAKDAASFFESLGFEAWIQETGGNPCIVGRCVPKSGPAAMNIVIYNHMDVVPAAQEDGWSRAPFAFHKEADAAEGMIYHGRGTTDDKGPALTALYGVLAALHQGVAVDVTFVWELEEEVGSPNFACGLRRMRPRLPPRIDMVICSDTLWISDAVPTVVETVRGSISFDVALETGTGDVHSGICGGVARNPLNELAHLAAAIAEPSGRPLVPGLQVAAPVKPGSELLSDVFGEVSAESFKKDFALHALRVEDPALILQRSWAEPCVEVVGFSGGWHGAGVKAAIPPKASLKFNVRLVMPQRTEDAEQVVRAFIRERLPDAQVEAFGRMEAFDGRLSSGQRAAMRKAYVAAFGVDPAFGCVGGSIGVLRVLREELQAQVLLPSLSSPSQGYHGKNEHYSWKRHEDGVAMYVALLTELVSQHHQGGETPGGGGGTPGGGTPGE